MNIKDFFASLGITVDEAAWKNADAVLNTFSNAIELVEKGVEAASFVWNSFIGDTIAGASEISKLAAVMGVSTTQAQEWSYAADQAGLSADDFAELAAELAENLGEASGGTGESADAFKSLGISVKDTNGKMKETPQVLGEIADKFSTMADGQAKTAAILGLFGDEGLKLLPILNQGSEGLAKYADEAHALGLVMDQELIELSSALGKDFKVLQKIFDSVRYTIGAQFLPLLEEVTQVFFEFWVANQAIIKQRIEKFFAAVTAAARMVYRALSPLAIALAWIGKKLYEFAGDAVILFAINALAGAFVLVGLSAVQAATSAAIAWAVAAAPLIGIAALLALVLLIAEDIWVWFNNGDSVLGDLLGTWDEFWYSFLAPAEEDPWWLVAIKTALRAARDLVDTLASLNPETIWEDTKDAVMNFDPLGLNEEGSFINDTGKWLRGEDTSPSAPAVSPEEQAALVSFFSTEFAKGMEALSNAPRDSLAGYAMTAGSAIASSTSNTKTTTVNNPIFSFVLPETITNPEAFGTWVEEKASGLLDTLLGEAMNGAK